MIKLAPSFIRKKILVAIITLLMLILLPAKGITLDIDHQEKIIALQEKVAKGYSDKFCNGIGIGISKDGAARLAISENTESKFNPLLWFELASSVKANIQKIDDNELAEVISSRVIEKCGRAIGLSGQKGVESFKEYFLTIKNEVTNQ